MKKALGFVSLCALALSACQPAQEKEPVKVGYIGPLTGGAAAYGVDTRNGVKMAIDDINASGGINGQEVQLIAEDGRCTGADAASAAQKLIHVDKVVAIVGGQCSGETLAVAPVAEAAQVVQISPVSSSPDITDAGDFIFRNYPSDALKTEALAKFFAEKGWEKIAMISENTDYAMALRSSLIENVPEDAIVFDEIGDPDMKDFRALVTRLKDREFDVFFANPQTEAFLAPLLQQIREQGIETQIVSQDIADSLTLAELVPDEIEGMYAINVPNVGEDTEFIQRFLSEYGSIQSNAGFVAHAYDATGVLMEAIKQVGNEGTAIRDYFYDLKGYQGVIGTFSFDENGDVVGVPLALKQFRDGKIVQVEEIFVD